MAWYPKAIRKNIPPGSNDPKIKIRGIVMHIRAGHGESLYEVFQTRGGIESHLYVRKTGVVEQYRDTQYEADAQTEGNSFIINGERWGHLSVEHEGVEGEPLTPEQIQADKEIILWAHGVHGVPFQRMETWNGRGIGWHSLFVEFNPLRKSCPTLKRINQIKTVIEPWYPTAIAYVKAREEAAEHPVVTPPKTTTTPPVVTPQPVYLKDSDMRVVQISSDKTPQRLFFLRGDEAIYIQYQDEARELLEITQQGTTHGIRETTLRKYYPEVSQLMTKLGQVYDEQKALGASVEQILEAQAACAAEHEETSQA